MAGRNKQRRQAEVLPELGRLKRDEDRLRRERVALLKAELAKARDP